MTAGEKPDVPNSDQPLVMTTVTTSAPPASQARNEEITLKTAGQRRINFIWEVTQSVIALLSVSAGVFIMVYKSIYGEPVYSLVVPDLPGTLSSMIFLVIGFYFARTNHDKTGGVGTRTQDNRGD